MKIIKVLPFFIVLSVSVFGQTSKSELTGFWDSGASWLGGTFPGSATSTLITATTKIIVVDGTIKSNKSVTLNASSLTINAADTVVILGDLDLVALASVTNNGVLVVIGNVSNGASALTNNGKMVVTGNYTNALGTNTFSGPSYLYGTSSGFLVAPSFSSKANLITNDVALYNWVNQMNSALPIELSAFEVYANGGSTDVMWSTASELSNDYFTIERSTNGKDFEKIGTVKGAGDSKESRSYRFVDSQPVVGKNYYRLSQTDFDGHKEYFKVLFVSIEQIISASIFPNPTSEYVYINNTTEEFTYSIRDVKGLSVSHGAADRETKISVESLKPGIYYIELTNNSKTGTLRFVKN